VITTSSGDVLGLYSFCSLFTDMGEANAHCSRFAQTKDPKMLNATNAAPSSRQHFFPLCNRYAHSKPTECIMSTSMALTESGKNKERAAKSSRGVAHRFIVG
jgi:predicted kinase